MLKSLVVDSSTLIALERANMITYFNRINYGIVVPSAVKEEVKSENILRFVKVMQLKGRTLKNSKSLERLNIGKGEAQCCALAAKLKLKFIICDDRKFIRQRFFLENKNLQNVKVLGFSFLLHLFYRKKLISDVWVHFNKIIKLNNWERSEIQVANYTFLRELGY